ncbi:probable phosphoglycerate mutase [Cohaesibacter sp. ES.047]|uniref:histidine phosphatase family protein n=1 Tax=Cohaesibacter sp. ES.047 TaxID=1798205 RepID=UPI000BB7C82C|nr:histidine phosphatase family protein [Cohaesibacter sp. ES.047]SNY92720.1 probable phosphoglycerate mutase [Cohaesibacter sp. ES.047]
MKVILVRHGNTFGPEDKVVWVGARSDLDLVEKGKEQAAAVGEALKQSGLKPSVICCGPLKRTIQTTDIASKHAGWSDVPIEITDALKEIDYGDWEGKSNEDIRAEFGDAAIDAWQKDSVWPEGLGWLPGAEVIQSNWNAMMVSIEGRYGLDAVAVIVTSNGILRLVAPRYGISASDAKVGTGHICLIEDGVVKVWNSKTLS